MADIIAKNMSTVRSKVLILSANEFRDTNGAPYVEVLYAVSGSPYYTTSKLQYHTALAVGDIRLALPNGATVSIKPFLGNISNSSHSQTLVIISSMEHLLVFTGKPN